MSTNINRENTQTVESKYFTNVLVMDESLSDFREPKKLAVIKPTKKSKSDKPKKAPKRIRGQKDIRSALRSKKNELESYANDFETVCQHAGLDVDSEQLQLAIALSKSLQPTTSTSEPETSQSQPRSSQDRVNKIRTTLLEYGFKVPEIKKTTSKRLKRRKNYKLLFTSEETKKQGIIDKYSQVLFQNVGYSKCFENTNSDVTHIHLYHLTTSATYSILKSIDTFYIDGLLEKSTSTSNLLRDWSEIPGRPVSPKVLHSSTMNFSEIQCSQEELDVVLSGSLKSCRNIINSKENAGKNKLGEKTPILNTKNSDNILVLKNNESTNNLEIVSKNYEVLQINDDNETLENHITQENQYRSSSPDLFDDEPSAIDEPSPVFSQDKVASKTVNDKLDLTDCDHKQKCNKSYSQQFQNVTERLNSSMEITSCVNDQYLVTNVINKTTVELSQDIKRKSNDFMEITNCVANPVKSQSEDADIDLIQSTKNQDKLSDLPITVTKITNENMNKAENLSNITNALEDNNIDLTESPEISNINKDVVEIAERSIESFDLTQSSNTSDELPFVGLKTNIRNSQKFANNSADDTVIIDPNEFRKISKSVFRSNDQILDLTSARQNEELNYDKEIVQRHSHSSQEKRNNKMYSTQCDQTSGQILDLTQNIVIVSRQNSKISENHLSFQESDIDLTQNSSIVMVPRQNSKTSENHLSLEESDIDLTQNSSSSEELSQSLRNKDSSQCQMHTSNIQNENESKSDSDSTVEMEIKSSQRCSSLGKKDDISIDYDDELYDRNKRSQSQCSRNLSKSLTENDPHTASTETESNFANVSKKSNDLSNCSQDSEVFVISDNELDYSMHQSKLERPVNNFELGGISIIDDFSCIAGLKSFRNIDNSTAGNNGQSADDIIEVENYNPNKTPVKLKRLSELSTPQKASCSGSNTVVTPSNHEYVMKTNDVTPMPNYEVMSTEEIHKELDGFGIKPFKRKRAIQLLTHIYNQTHPTIDPHSDESPRKKRKTNDCQSPRNSSPRKVLPRVIISPRKSAKSPLKVGKKSKDASKASAVVTNERLNYIELEKCEGKDYGVVETPVIKEIECSPSDWVFQKREKAKVHSCRVPLHIAFHNYVSSRRGLREAILCYEPVNIDDIHKELVAYGHRYDPKELLKFMDKKCITVKTTENDGRNQKK